MRFWLVSISIFLFILAMVITLGIGIGFLLHWIMPVVELGSGIVIGAVAAAFSLYSTAHLLSSVSANREAFDAHRFRLRRPCFH
jgi:NhaP-type Na+/H+ or K+/H+ antiporter